MRFPFRRIPEARANRLPGRARVIETNPDVVVLA